MLRRALVLTHRWLGLAGCVLIAAWFVSGVAMMYSRMPRLTAEDRLKRLPALDLSTAKVPLDLAARTAGEAPQRARVGMLLTRPVYRLQYAGRWATVFADTGERLTHVTPALALDLAGSFIAGDSSALEYDALVESPDQWTLQLRPLLPAHRIRVNDRDATRVYVSDGTGEVVLTTTRRSRAWGYAGAVIHWLYFTPLRRHAAIWSNVVIWSAVAGCVLCLTGLVWGAWQIAGTRASPYAGLLRWHHYAGLAFGAVTLTFVFSGLLSMEPLDWAPGTAANRAQREAVAGGPLTVDGVTVSALQAVTAAFTAEFAIRELEIVQFRGQRYAEAYRAPAAADRPRETLGDPGDVLGSRMALPHRLVAIGRPDNGAFARFSDDDMMQAAQAAMPGVSKIDASWLGDYDAYYYDREGVLPLPVLRVRYADSVGTWLYLDPERGTIVRKEERLTRLNRWLYRGFHSFDWPWLYRRRPLWDVVLMGVSAAGLFLTLSASPAAWRRLARARARARAELRTKN